ncbi:hypothetical protein BC826DRAFT_1103174 [Russula brevipes]|nr:hypothetical protein BC826DRAFT_1103174 [Russula brevipes]
MDLVFDVPHFMQFIGRAKGLNPFKVAELLFYPWFIRLNLDRPHGLKLDVRCDRIDWQLDSMVRVCGQLSPFFSSIERFDLTCDDEFIARQGEDDMESTQCLEIFQPFMAIQSLYELIGETVTEVLPNLRDLFLGGSAISRSIREDIQPFIEARRLSGQPVAVHRWGGGEN